MRSGKTASRAELDSGKVGARNKFWQTTETRQENSSISDQSRSRDNDKTSKRKPSTDALIDAVRGSTK